MNSTQAAAVNHTRSAVRLVSVGLLLALLGCNSPTSSTPHPTQLGVQIDLPAHMRLNDTVDVVWHVAVHNPQFYVSGQNLTLHHLKAFLGADVPDFCVMGESTYVGDVNPGDSLTFHTPVWIRHVTPALSRSMLWASATFTESWFRDPATHQPDIAWGTHRSVVISPDSVSVWN
jgi:hypothetical protein